MGCHPLPLGRGQVLEPPGSAFASAQGLRGPVKARISLMLALMGRRPRVGVTRFYPALP